MPLKIHGVDGGERVKTWHSGGANGPAWARRQGGAGALAG